MKKQRLSRTMSGFFRYLLHSVPLGIFAVLFSIVLNTTASALTTVPTKINFQGRLTDTTGVPVADGLYNMQFKLYDNVSGGTLKWSETRETTNRVQITNGLFSTKLGDVTPMDATIFASGSLYFEITQATPATANCSTAACATWESPMSSRTLVAASAYAYNSETLDGLDSSALGQLSANNTWTGTNAHQVTSATAFTIQNAGGAATLLTANTSTMNVTLGTGASLTITGSGSRPGSTAEGMLYYDTTTKQILVYANGKWQADRTNATLVAASDSTQAAKDAADFVADGNTAAAGDGDQIQINQAMADANPAGTGRKTGKVYLFPGTYTIDAQISVPNNTTIAGAGEGTVITIPNSFNTSINAVTNATSGGSGTGVVVQDLRLDGNSANQTSGTMNGVYIDAAGSGSGSTAIIGAEVTNVWSNNWRSSGIALFSGLNTIVSGNRTQGNGNGITASSGSNHTFVSNYSTGNTRGFSITSSYSTITGNVAQTNTTYGIYLGGSNNTVSGNTVADSGNTTTNNALYLSGASNNTITGNNLTDTGSPASNYAINISDFISVGNYFADNTLGAGGVLDGGNGTIFGGQVNASGNFIIQPAGTIELQKNTNVTGTLSASTSILTQSLDRSSAGTLNIGTNGTNTTAISIGSSSSTVTLTSAVSAASTLDIAGSVATKKGTDYSATGTTNDVNFGDVSLVRLTGASTQTITGITGVRDGKQLTIINAAAQMAFLANASTSSTAIYRITTGIGADLGIPAGSSISLIYDSGANLWRVVGTTATAVPMVRAYTGTNQSIPNAGSWTIINLEQEDLDNNTFHDTVTNNSRFTVATAGVYKISGTIGINDASTTGNRFVGIFLNGNTGAPLAESANSGTGAASYTHMSASVMKYLNVGDYVTIGVIQYSGSAVTTIGSSTHDYFEMYRIDGGMTNPPVSGGVSLSANNTWTGTNAYQVTSATAFSIQNAGGAATLLTANTSTMNLALGTSASLTLNGGATGTRPTGAEGMLYYDTTTKQLLTYANGKWQADRTTSTKIVAASNSTQAAKDAADYVATSDAGTTINDALTAAAGGKVYLMEGTYSINTTIYVPNNTTLAGAGPGSIIIPINSSGIQTVIANNGTTGMTLQDLTIDGNAGGGQPFDITGILFSALGSGGLAGGRVTNVTVTNTIEVALRLTSSANTTVTNSTFNTGMDIFNSSNNVISHNTIQNTGGVAVRFYDNSSNNKLSDNTIQKGSTGVSIGQIAGNPAHNTIANNLIQLNSNYGLFISNGGDSTTISDNVFQDNGGATTNNAIYIDQYASNTTIAGNRISDASASTTNFPITLVALSANTYLSGNYFDGGTINDASTSTTYVSQSTAASGLAQLYRQSNSATAFRIQDGSSVAVLTADTSTNRIVIGTNDANGTTLVLDSKSGTGDPTGVAGAMYYNGGTAADAGFRCYQGGGWQNCFGGLYSAIADSSVLTGTTLTAQTLNNAYTMPANYCTQGRTVHLSASGVTTTTTAAQPMTFTVTLGATTIATQIPATVTPSVSQTNLAWTIDLNFTCRAAPSAASAVYAQGTLALQSTTAAAASVYPLATASYTTVNVATNATAAVGVKITYGATANAANTIRLKEMSLNNY